MSAPRLLLALLGACCVAGPCAAAPTGAPLAADTFEARVLRVSDGDTLWVVSEAADSARRRKPLKLRLVGIDAPERCQPHGDAATRALTALVLGQRVTVRRRATDGHGRALGTLSLNGEDIAARLVREGHAWSARRFDRPVPYGHEEQAARVARRGLFAQHDPQYPSEFRRERGPCPQVTAASP